MNAEEYQRNYAVCVNRGYVLALTSAYMFLWSHHDGASYHFRRHNLGEFKRLFENAKFEVIKISYINTFLFPAILLVRLMQKLTGIDKRIHKRDLIQMPSFLNKSLLSLLGLEGSLVRRVNLPFGVGLICVARKSCAMSPNVQGGVQS